MTREKAKNHKSYLWLRSVQASGVSCYNFKLWTLSAGSSYIILYYHLSDFLPTLTGTEITSLNYLIKLVSFFTSYMLYFNIILISLISWILISTGFFNVISLNLH